MIINQTRHIDLTVPTSWNQCTVDQLEAIAQILLRHMTMQDRYHPYDPDKMKIEVFFALAGLEVVSFDLTCQTPDTSVGEETFFVRQTPHTSILSTDDKIFHFSSSIFSKKKPKPFPLKVWQVHSFIDQHLRWLDDFSGLWIFPYPVYKCYWKVDRQWPFFHRHMLEGPAPLLDGVTWRQYRFANDWLSAYTNRESREAREGFLKAIFNVIDEKRTPRPLRRMRDDQFQLCLIWWQSMMKEMQGKYRRCFTVGRKPSAKVQTPIELYTRSMATLQDKYHLTEDEINRQPCRVILQHLEDMSREAEEIEKINRRSKLKH